MSEEHKIGYTFGSKRFEQAIAKRFQGATWNKRTSNHQHRDKNKKQEARSALSRVARKGEETVA
jgi:hypothetical protein